MQTAFTVRLFSYSGSTDHWLNTSACPSFGTCCGPSYMYNAQMA